LTSLDQALAGAQHAPAAAAASRTAFVIGNTGKLGEELLNVLLESPQYAAIHVGVRKAMRSHVPKLHPMVVPGDLAAWDPCAEIKTAPEDLYLCI
jgi:N-acetyl-gamma-glutamylphosphate reductase